MLEICFMLTIKRPQQNQEMDIPCLEINTQQVCKSWPVSVSLNGNIFTCWRDFTKSNEFQLIKAGFVN